MPDDYEFKIGDTVTISHTAVENDIKLADFFGLVGEIKYISDSDPFPFYVVFEQETHTGYETRAYTDKPAIPFKGRELLLADPYTLPDIIPSAIDIFEMAGEKR